MPWLHRSTVHRAIKKTNTLIEIQQGFMTAKVEKLLFPSDKES